MIIAFVKLYFGQHPSKEIWEDDEVDERLIWCVMAETMDLKESVGGMFDTFRSQLDQHHDRRERVIKASRDVTALSKKIIFSLQRLRALKQPIPASITKENAPRYQTIETLLSGLKDDLSGLNGFRYQRQVSPGLQEYMEAVIFEHYLVTQTLLSYELAQERVPQGILLTEADYLLGVFDAVGEIMRFAITMLATTRADPGAARGERSVVTDLRELRSFLEGLRVHGADVGREFYKKLEVMQTCVEKVENAAYSVIVRGSEKPAGWTPTFETVDVEV